jgi:NhaP-type Na+/H+ or K+/H+ antiporter
MHGLEFRLEILIGLLSIVALLAQLARMVGVPYPIFLVLGGIGVGLVPVFPDVVLPPEIIFLVFIPPLLLSAALSSSPRDLYTHARPIGLLSICLVLLTTSTVAAVVTGTFSVAAAGLQFLLVSGGGIIIGAVVAGLVVSLRDAGEINADVMRRVERDIDLEELRQSG